MSFSKLDLQLDEFKPILGFYTGHTQTLIGHVVPSPYINFDLTKVFLTLDDGDQLVIEYADLKSDTTLSLYHGLAGDAHSDYMRRTAILAKKMGWNVVLVNHRGIKNAKAKYTYHSGRGEDACAVIRWCKNKFPNTKQVAVGFSMSGSIVLSLLTQKSGYELPDYAVVVHAPLDLEKSSIALSKGLSKIYDARFYLLLKKIIKEREQEVKNKTKMPLIGRTYDVDRLYSAKTNGFNDALDYYTSCSVINAVDQIKTKTFVLSAYDDPFIDVNDYLKANWSENVHLSLLKHGGHMGYYSKINHPKYGYRWLDHYLENVFSKISQL